MQPAEWKTLREIEDVLRSKDPDLDGFLAGRSAFRRPWLMICAVYVVCPVLIVLGVALDVMPLVVAGVVAAPLIPVTTWLLGRRRSR
jgi:Flp pilus assembly protein TadB